MREILFRGIPKDDIDRHFFTDAWKENCEGSFVYGSLVVAHDRYYICVSALCAINSCVNNGMTSMIEVIPETVGQYTGKTLCDTKVFKGDIVEWYEDYDDSWGYTQTANGYSVVVWDDENFCWGFDTDGYVQSFNDWDWYKCFVIGNIHDNPELLKEGTT